MMQNNNQFKSVCIAIIDSQINRLNIQKGVNGKIK
jgi:hypothetical protein